MGGEGEGQAGGKAVQGRRPGLSIVSVGEEKNGQSELENWGKTYLFPC